MLMTGSNITFDWFAQYPSRGIVQTNQKLYTYMMWNGYSNLLKNYVLQII